MFEIRYSNQISENVIKNTCGASFMAHVYLMDKMNYNVNLLNKTNLLKLYLLYK